MLNGDGEIADWPGEKDYSQQLHKYRHTIARGGKDDVASKTVEVYNDNGGVCE